MESLLQDPIQCARCSLEGLSVGDAFGETFFINPDVVEGLIAQRALATRTWNYTDDTQMALSIFSVLRQYGHIHHRRLLKVLPNVTTVRAAMDQRCIVSCGKSNAARIGRKERAACLVGKARSAMPSEWLESREKLT